MFLSKLMKENCIGIDDQNHVNEKAFVEVDLTKKREGGRLAEQTLCYKVDLRREKVK